MPRNASGVYSLPNAPVVPGTTITSVDENTTRSDMATELTNSLDRSGRGSMLASFKAFDGTVGAPGITFGSDTDNGLYRIGPNNIGFAIAGAKLLDLTSNTVTVSSSNTLGTLVKILCSDAGGKEFAVFSSGSASSGGAGLSGVFNITDNKPIIYFNGRAAGGVSIGTTSTSATDWDATSLLQIGDGGGGAGTRTAIRLRNGGFAVPSVTNALSNGDKFVYWNDTNLKIATGVSSGELFFQNHGSITTGGIKFYGGSDNATPAVELHIVTPIASQVNYWVLHGRGTGNRPVFGVNGSDSNIDTAFVSKGTGAHAFFTGGAWDANGVVSAGNIQAQIIHTASANRYITFTGANSANPTIGTNAGDLQLSAAGGNAFTVHAAGDASLTATKRLFLDGGSNTYFQENSADVIHVVTGGTARLQIASSGLGLIDSNATHFLSLVAGSDLTAGRTLTFTTGDANRTLTINADTTLTGGIAGIAMGTEVAATSGTSIDFTGIPAGTKRIVINFVGVSMNGAANMIVQIGDSGGVETTGYLGAEVSFSAAALATTNQTGGFACDSAMGAAIVAHGQVTLCLEDASDFTWTANSQIAHSNGTAHVIASGSKSLSAELDRVRITTVAGTATFDAGVINIQYT